MIFLCFLERLFIEIKHFTNCQISYNNNHSGGRAFPDPTLNFMTRVHSNALIHT